MRTTSSLQAWDIQSRIYQEFDSGQKSLPYPDYSGENWAVVVGTSDTWANYRHQADVKDPEMGIWLSNGFTREFQETIDAKPGIVLRDLYYALAGNTVGSHATVYNVENYGNMYKESMSEYFQTNK